LASTVNHQIQLSERRLSDEDLIAQDHGVLQLSTPHDFHRKGLGKIERLTPAICVFGDTLANSP
jgi:hypothetical protein